jgi:hypothetical protein
VRAQGPAIEHLTRRLAACPAAFLAAPEIEGRGEVRVGAVVSDLLRDLGGGALAPEEARGIERASSGVRRLRLMLIAAWLLHDEWFRGRPGLAAGARPLLEHGLDELAGIVAPERFVDDADRREELARLVLAALGLRPAGESAAQAQDRLRTLDSAERRRVIGATREAERRAREVREAMQKKAAQEAAASYGRE